MINRPLVSVVITTYKREKSIVREAIESVLEQTYHPLEIIVIDDNGNESVYSSEIKELCSSFTNIYYIANEKNCGAQVSRNKGISVSRGEYVAFLDDDDIWRNDKIEVQMQLFSDKQIGMVYCDGYSFYDNDIKKLGVFREASIFDRPISHKMEMFNDFIGSTSQAIVRKECFDVVGGFDERLPARQDYEMWLRISQKYTIVGTPEKLLYYRIHSGNRISTNWDKCLKSYQLVLKKYKNEYDEYKYAKAKLILYMAKFSRKKRDYLKSLYYTIYAFVTSPRCLFDIMLRKITKSEFVDFYNSRI